MKPEIAEILAKCKAGLIDYQANVNTIDFEKFATDMKNEQEFLNGLQKQLVPWMDEAEVTANKNLQKPGNFEDAREIEKQGEGMRILISETSMRLIQKVGGFRCESRGTLDVKVQYPVHNF